MNNYRNKKTGKQMARYLDPKNDLAFKQVFGEHKHLCMSLLNSMLPLDKPIVNIEYQSGELLPKVPALPRRKFMHYKKSKENNYEL